ncbi:MAG: hypothetical protein HXY21_12020 [Parvularculaceae bacterium]|nr:hypothetical protein [Parvularculaceae bacterium]
MGRLLVFLIVVAAALAGIWFYAPGGKDMLLGAKEKVMGVMPGGADDAADATSDAVDETADAVDEAVDATSEAVDEAAEVVEEATDDAAAEEPQN